MEHTKLLYMEDMQALECSAYIESIEDKEGKTIVYLDQTVFYPQGGGQPYDNGTISAGNIVFTVNEVRFSEGQVQHIGTFSGGRFMAGEEVNCVVDAERRKLHTRLHSGGHVLDMAVNELGYTWKPVKAFHFPEGPYIEYEGDLDGEFEDALMVKLNDKIADILSRGITTEIRFVTIEEMAKLCRHVPEFLPKDKPSRVVLYGDFGVPCGGTHVAQLSDIGRVNIRKIKIHGATIKLSYEVLAA